MILTIRFIVGLGIFNLIDKVKIKLYFGDYELPKF
jgi:hypothetical protein